MAMNMDAAIRIKANVQGGNSIQAFSRDLKGLDGAAKLSGLELGRMNLAINKMAREAGNTTAGLRQHMQALQALRERTEIGSKAYNRLGKEITALQGKLRGLDKDAEKTGNTLKDKLIGGLTLMGVTRVAGGIVRTASTFDAELRKAAAIEGGGNFDKLRKDIEAVAAAAAGTPTEVAQLATALSRAGFTADETGKALRGIVLGAEATSVAFEEMGSITADAMRAMGIEVGKTEAVVDILVKTANSSNQTVQDLGESLKYAAPIARSLGVNINDLAATMGILANNGIRGSEAGTALRSGLQRLQLAASGSNDQLLGLTKGSKLLANAMKTLGADVVDARGELLPLDEVLIKLKQNLEKLPVGVQSELIKALFGDEAGGKLRAALNSTEADIRKMFDTIRNSKGAAEETREAMRGFDDSLKVLGGNIEIVTNAIGEKFILVLKPLVDGLSATIGLMQSLPKPIKDVAAAAAAAGIAVGGLALAFKGLAALGVIALLGGIATKAAGLALALKGLTAAALAAKIKMIALNAVLLINPWFALAAGITAAAVALAGYKRENDKVIQSLRTGGAAELNNARNRLVNLETQLTQLEQKRANRTVTRRIQQLRKDTQALRSAINEAEGASRTNIIPAATTTAGAFDPISAADSERSARAAKKAADISREELLYRTQMITAKAEGNRLVEAALQLELDLLEVAKMSDTPNKQRLAREEAYARFKQAELDAAKEIGGAVAKDYIERINKAEEFNRVIEDLKIKTGEISGEKLKELQINREIADILKRFPDLTQAQIDKVRELVKAAAEATKSFGESFKEKFEDYVETVKDLGGAMGDAVVNAFKGMEDALTEFVMTGKANFADLARSIIADLTRIAIRAAIIQPLLGAFGGLFGGGAAAASPTAAGGDVWGAVGRLLGNANGNVFGQNGVVPFARGGIVSKPTLFPFAKGTGLMGEAGPEAIIPLKRGKDGKLGIAGGGATNVVVNVDASGSNVQGDSSRGEQLGRAISQAVQSELLKQKRPGGLLAA